MLKRIIKSETSIYVNSCFLYGTAKQKHRSAGESCCEWPLKFQRKYMWISFGCHGFKMFFFYFLHFFCVNTIFSWLGHFKIKSPSECVCVIHRKAAALQCFYELYFGDNNTYTHRENKAWNRSNSLITHDTMVKIVGILCSMPSTSNYLSIFIQIL